MNIFDRITLLKAGYSRKEIEQMIADDKAAEEAAVLKAQEDPEEYPKPEQPEEAKQPEPEQPKAPEIDYKLQYEKEKAAKEALQEANRNRDNLGNKGKSDEQIVSDFVASFL